MAILITPSGYFYGVPAVIPHIPGYLVTALPDAWLTCRKGGKTYMVRDTPTHWILERYGPDLWSRHAARLRKHRHKQRMEDHAWMASLKPRMKPKSYAGERLKGIWTLDPSEAIAIRKPNN